MIPLEISDDQMHSLLDVLNSMSVPSIFPADARESGHPFVERHHVAGGGIVFSVWYETTIIPNLDYAWKAADAFLEQLGISEIPLPALSSSAAVSQ